MGVLAVALPLTSVAFLTSPAGAATKPPPFTGAATGSVTCTAPVIKISFSPPLTFTTGGTTITAKGKLGGCTTSAGSNVNISKAKITGTFGGAGTGCDGLATGITTNVNFTIQWKGKTKAGGKATLTNSTVVLSGAAPSTNGAGDVGFQLPNPADAPGGSVVGSFPAAPLTTVSKVYSAMTETALGAKCAKKVPNLKVVSGSIVLP